MGRLFFGALVFDFSLSQSARILPLNVKKIKNKAFCAVKQSWSVFSSENVAPGRLVRGV